jgi:hydroxymethylbilane synthase
MKVLGATSARGVFVREIEEALLSGRIDLAVHSLKDLPTAQPDGLHLVAVSDRHDPRDAIMSIDGFDLETLPRGAVLGTGSFRRRTQLLNLRPDLIIRPVRGNLQTRIRKLKEKRYDALVLALAGVQRLAMDEIPVQPIPEEICLPAVGQGILGLETRVDDPDANAAVQVLEHGPTRKVVEAERAFLHHLGGGCLAPATGFATWEGDGLLVRAVVGDPEGRELLRDQESGSPEQAGDIGRCLADRMLKAGAARMLEQAREAAEEEEPPAPS